MKFFNHSRVGSLLLGLIVAMMAGLGRASVTSVVDFDGDGIIDFKDFCELAQHWAQQGSAGDIAPLPFGDQMVDFGDLALFAESWLKDLRLVAHWKLDETEGAIAHDIAGGRDGTLQGGPLWLAEGGKVRGALQLDGLDDYVQTDCVLDPADGPFSTFAWIKGGAEGQVILSQAGDAQSSTSWLSADAEDGRLMTELKAPDKHGSPLISESVITGGDWHHVGFVWDGWRRVLYVDGAEVVRDNKPTTELESSQGSLYFGAASTPDAASLWSGLIDDIRIYDQALSDDEVGRLTDTLLSQSRRDVTVERAKEIQEKYTDFLLGIEGVVAVAVGYDQHYQVVIKVFVSEPDVSGIPEQLEGVKIEVIVTGQFYAIAEPNPADGLGDDDPVDRTARFARPVPIGVSTGHPNITAGTLGCRLRDEQGNVYALSNNHVYANSNSASTGDNVLQPGAYDGGQDPDDAVGTLFDFEPIDFTILGINTIDAAIARCSLETLANATPPDGYGKPRSKTAVARLHQKVRKYGRTTGLTEGRVDAINATLMVLYRNPDYDPDTGTGGPPFRLARFAEQILVVPGADFARPGDSGSLVVTPAKKAVGLLFAGSDLHTACNIIDSVLQRFGLSIDDQN